MGSRTISSLSRLFIGNLPWTIGRTELIVELIELHQPIHVRLIAEELKDYFTQFGQVATAQVIFNKETGLNRGFGFIKFADDAAYDAVKSKEKHILEGNTVNILNFSRSLGLPPIVMMFKPKMLRSLVWYIFNRKHFLRCYLHCFNLR